LVDLVLDVQESDALLLLLARLALPAGSAPDTQGADPCVERSCAAKALAGAVDRSAPLASLLTKRLVEP
jgi:hypothetical protein